MRDTPVFSAKTWKGRRILRVMRECGMSAFRGVARAGRRRRSGNGFDQGLGGRLRFSLRFLNRPDHVKRGLREVLVFVAKDPLAAVQRILEADQLSCEAGELLGGEKG